MDPTHSSDAQHEFYSCKGSLQVCILISELAAGKLVCVCVCVRARACVGMQAGRRVGWVCKCRKERGGYQVMDGLVCVCACVCLCDCAPVCVRMHARVCMCLCVCAFVCVYIYVCVSTCTHACALKDI